MTTPFYTALTWAEKNAEIARLKTDDTHQRTMAMFEQTFPLARACHLLRNQDDHTDECTYYVDTKTAVNYVFWHRIKRWEVRTDRR